MSNQSIWCAGIATTHLFSNLANLSFNFGNIVKCSEAFIEVALKPIFKYRECLLQFYIVAFCKMIEP